VEKKKINNNTINLNINRTLNSHGYCFVCKLKFDDGFTNIKTNSIKYDCSLDIFISIGILIPEGSRCCRKHLTDYGYLKPELIDSLEIQKDNINMKIQNIEKLIENLRVKDQKNSIFSRFEDMQKVDNELVMKITGFNKDDFMFIMNQLKSINNSPIRKKSQALAVYLFWLKTGLSQALIGTFFGIDKEGRVGFYCDQIRNAFKTDFVDQFLGAAHLAREDFLLKNTETVKTLFDLDNNQLVIICDGTYIYCEKSLNNYLQRLLYTDQKKRPLIKPFVICTSNGYIIDVLGPFPAKNNDATILDEILKSNDNLKNLLKPNDLVILDRGFRDIIKKLEKDYKLITKMPTCKFNYN
jgi:hypothetical protein